VWESLLSVALPVVLALAVVVLVRWHIRRGEAGEQPLTREDRKAQRQLERKARRRAERLRKRH
jgi:hypothetical protein